MSSRVFALKNMLELGNENLFMTVETSARPLGSEVKPLQRIEAESPRPSFFEVYGKNRSLSAYIPRERRL